jgi:anti-sigma factor RsiW
MTDSPCPDPATLTAYVTGRIDDAELAAIASHLIDCELCYQTVAAKARSLAFVERTENTEPPLALLPALLTGAVMALALSASLLLLAR